jgi:hypothetical protein
MFDVARDGGTLVVTVLGPVGTVEGFDVFWESAASVNPDLVGPDHYPHHSLGEAERLAGLVTAAGWTIEWSGSTIGTRVCNSTELWGWLWRSLPLRRKDGTFLEGDLRSEWEDRIRMSFFQQAQRWIASDKQVEDPCTKDPHAKVANVDNQHTEHQHAYEFSPNTRYRIPSTTHTIRAKKIPSQNRSRAC